VAAPHGLGNVGAEKNPSQCGFDVLVGSVTAEARPDAGSRKRSNFLAQLVGEAQAILRPHRPIRLELPRVRLNRGVDRSPHEPNCTGAWAVHGRFPCLILLE
jgi:hypothetical protein